MRVRYIFIAAILLLTFAGAALGAVTAEEAKKLGTTLTALGAEKAGNKDGSIPEYTGGIAKAPANYTKKGWRPDPFADEKPLFAITAKNMDQYKHIFARNQQGQYLLNPVRQLRELAKIENSLPEKGKAAPVRQVTQAPRPPHQASGKGTVGKDAVETALEENDSEAYMREANARALARLKKGK